MARRVVHPFPTHRVRRSGAVQHAVSLEAFAELERRELAQLRLMAWSLAAAVGCTSFIAALLS